MAMKIDETTINISEEAAGKARDLLSRELEAAPDEHEGKSYALRVAVQPGGCAGLRYNLFFDDRQLEGDLVNTVAGLEIRVDKMSSPYLRGAEIDYVDTIQQSGFTINNPNASGTCACGDSAQF